MPFTADRNWYEIRTQDLSPGRPALLLDRDGVLIEDRHYLGDPDGVRLLPGAEALRAARGRSFRLVITSNQSGVGRGFFDWPDLFAVQERLRQLWAAEGLAWDMALFCPHHPDGSGLYARDHDWRKPGCGMIRFAAERLGLDLARSIAVGDKLSDLTAAARAGVGRLVHVATGQGAAEREKAAARYPEAERLPSLAALALDRPPVELARQPG